MKSSRLIYLFMVPALVAYCFVTIGPALAGAWFAFTNWNGLDQNYQLVGFANFVEAFGDRQIRAAIFTTIFLAVMFTLLTNVVGLGLALLLNTEIRSRNFLRTLFFAPVVLTPVVVSFLWKYIFSTRGGINYILTNLGLIAEPVNWLGSSSIAIWSIIIVAVWQSAGVAMAIYLAGLQNVPRELLEASEIDGAGPAHRLWYVVLPMLKPAIMINVVLSTINGLKIFDQVTVLTNGGPGYATEVLSTVIYKTSFVLGEYGYATAIALIMTLFICVLAFIQLRILNREPTNG